MILDELAQLARQRVAENKKKKSLEEVKKEALELASKEEKFNFPFEEQMKKQGLSFICEVKKASPSKGLIAGDFPYIDIAMDYEKAGANCISVLTEPFKFLGSDAYLKEINERVSIPTIRKDFTVDEYMIYEAKILGASCVLLIAAILDTATIKRYLEICDSLGLSAIVEAHDEEEVKSALQAGARMVGVNNRNLKDFTVDINNSIRLRKMVPSDIIFIAESGMKTKQDIAMLRDAGVDGVLIGETLMRAADKKAMIDELRGCSSRND